jgi:hypothetical protein
MGSIHVAERIVAADKAVIFKILVYIVNVSLGMIQPFGISINLIKA